MRALIRSFREDARAALSELDATSAPDPRGEVPEANGLPLPGLRSTACAEPRVTVPPSLGRKVWLEPISEGF
jgi:hypothetical protein